MEDLNHFLDLREEQNSIEAQINTLKGRVVDIVPEGRKTLTLEGLRKNERGRFQVTLVTRDNREYDEEKTVTLLEEKIDHDKSLQDALVVKTTFDQERVDGLVESGVITRAELRRILVGKVSTFPKVTFKPDFDDDDS